MFRNLRTIFFCQGGLCGELRSVCDEYVYSHEINGSDEDSDPPPVPLQSSKVYACLFTREKEKSSFTKLAPVCFKNKLSVCVECTLNYHEQLQFSEVPTEKVEPNQLLRGTFGKNLWLSFFRKKEIAVCLTKKHENLSRNLENPLINLYEKKTEKVTLVNPFRPPPHPIKSCPILPYSLIQWRLSILGWTVSIYEDGTSCKQV